MSTPTDDDLCRNAVQLYRAEFNLRTTGTQVSAEVLALAARRNSRGATDQRY